MADTPNSEAGPMNDDEAAAMQAQVDAYKAAKAKQAEDARATKLKPLTDLLGSEAWATFRAQIGAATTAAIGESFYDSVRALDVISGNIAGLIAPPAAAAS